MKNRKGFTLIELLAVIVILGIIMLVAIPAVTGYISGSRNDSYINDASLFVDGMKNVAITKNRLPFADDQVALFQVWNDEGTGLSLESGGKQSPYGVAWDEDYTYIAIARVNGNYRYAFVGNDEQGNYVPLSTLEYLTDPKTKFKVQNAGSKENSEKCIVKIATGSAETFECTIDGSEVVWKQTNKIEGEDTVSEKLGFTSRKNGTDISDPDYIWINGLQSSDVDHNGQFKVVKIYVDNK